jgi:hypothetical protein
MKIILGDFNAKEETEDIFKSTIGNERLYKANNDNGIRVIKWATTKNLIAKSRIFPYRNAHILVHTWTSIGGKTHNPFDHVLNDRRMHSIALHVRSFRGAGCDPGDHWLVFA